VNVLPESGTTRVSPVLEAWDAERRLVGDVRAALPVEAQTIFFRELDDLLALLEEPRCAEAQADGVPCPRVEVGCEECGRALGWVRDLRNAIARSAR
jgi:hypothetical protein